MIAAQSKLRNNSLMSSVIEYCIEFIVGQNIFLLGLMPFQLTLPNGQVDISPALQALINDLNE